jgi:hypothetical protein
VVWEGYAISGVNGEREEGATRNSVAERTWNKSERGTPSVRCQVKTPRSDDWGYPVRKAGPPRMQEYFNYRKRARSIASAMA